MLSAVGRGVLFKGLCGEQKELIMGKLAENGDVIDQLVTISEWIPKRVDTGYEKEEYTVFLGLPDARSADVLMNNLRDPESGLITEADWALQRLLKAHPEVFTTSQLQRVCQLQEGEYFALTNDFSFDTDLETRTWDPTPLRELAAKELHLRAEAESTW